MSKNKKIKSHVSDNIIVLDPCGVNVLDINGSHLVNFRFEIQANDSNEETRFDGDIELILPHNLPKNQKLAKLDVTHPSMNWKSSVNVLIDDNFINMIKEKKLIYKFTFLQRIPGHKGPTKLSLAAKKAQAENKIVIPTLFFDASTLLIRGGRFKPNLKCSASYKVPGFANFDVSLSIDIPILSDVQIRRFQPHAIFIKGVHQIPSIGNDENRLDDGKYIPPYLVLNVCSQNLTTIPRKYGSDIKLNIGILVWGPSDFDSIKVELHDRENSFPESTCFIGDGFVTPPNPEEPSEVLQLSIMDILDVPKDDVRKPFGKTSITFKPGRHSCNFQPFSPKDSAIHTPFYVEEGTYITCEIEDMSHVLPEIPKNAAPPRQTSNRHQSLSALAKKGEKLKSLNPLDFHRYAIITQGSNFMTFQNGLQEHIGQLNAKVLDKDISAIPTTKITSIDSEAITGVIIMFPKDVYLVLLETRDGSETDKLFTMFLKMFSNNPGITSRIFMNNDRLYTERLYWQFDCSIKKLKFGKPVSEILLEPEIYMQQSSLSSCYKIFNQINRLLTIKSFNEIDQDDLWPSKIDIETANAKKGVTLDFDELSFPPQPPETTLQRLSRVFSKPPEKPNEEIPVFTYTPINEKKKETPPHDLKYFQNQTKQYIKRLDQKTPKKKGCIQVAEDGETEIWEANSILKSPDNKGWELQTPEKYVSLLYETTSPGILNLFRTETGEEIKNGKKFYNYRSPKSALGKREQLLVDVNNEPWYNDDLSMYSQEQKWLDTTRGPLSSAFKNVFRKREYFHDPGFQSIQDKYRPHTAFEKRNYVTKPLKHKQRFNPCIPPISKEDSILLGHKEEPPISISEPYKENKVITTPRINGKPRFTNQYHSPMKKGETNSKTVKKLKENLPKIGNK